MDDPRILPPDRGWPLWRCREPPEGRSISTVRRQPGRCSTAMRASQPDAPPPPDWDRIPGAHGRTAQARDFRDLHQRLVALGAVVFGISTQTASVRREVATQLRLPLALLSDDGFPLTKALDLPTSTAGAPRLLRRLTLVVRHGVIETVFYPIFPPDRSTGRSSTAWWSRRTG